MIDPPTWEEALPRLPTVNGYRNRLPFAVLLDVCEERPISDFQPNK